MIKKEIAHKIMYALKASSIGFPLCNTSLGQLSINLRKDEEEWFMTLDAVQVDKNTQKDLIKLLEIEE